jgi:hypothetical protein
MGGTAAFAAGAATTGAVAFAAGAGAAAGVSSPPKNLPTKGIPDNQLISIKIIYFNLFLNFLEE